MKTRITDAINGYCFSGNESDEQMLVNHGIRRLTANKDIQKMDENPETLLETLLVATFPGGGYNDSDDYFIAEADGYQYLIIEHAGQWFVGDNYADTRDGLLLNTESGNLFRVVPSEALKLNNILTKAGYSKENPLVFQNPVIITQTTDMPGVLDFYEPAVTAVWPEAGTIALLTEKDGPVKVIDRIGTQDDPTDSYWGRSKFENIINCFLDPVPAVEALSALLAEAIPVGTLALPKGTSVLFREADGGLRWYDLVEVSANNGNPLVCYELKGERINDFARDLGAEDIRNILYAIGHPVKETPEKKPEWDFTYDEEFPDSAGYNCVGILRDKNSDSPFSCLFFHILKDDEDDEVETMHIYSSLYNLFKADCDEIAFPWTSENEDILVAYLNGLPDIVNLCGDDGLLRQLEFVRQEKKESE